MSFLSVLKKIGTIGLAVERVAAPVLSVTVPGFAAVDAIVNHVVSAVVSAEQTYTDAKSGALKSAAVMQSFTDSLAVAQEIAKARGKLLVWDADALQEAINGQVAMLNAMAKLKASFHEQDLPK